MNLNGVKENILEEIRYYEGKIQKSTKNTGIVPKTYVVLKDPSDAIEAFWFGTQPLQDKFVQIPQTVYDGLQINENSCRFLKKSDSREVLINKIAYETIKNKFFHNLSYIQPSYKDISNKLQEDINTHFTSQDNIRKIDNCEYIKPYTNNSWTILNLFWEVYGRKMDYFTQNTLDQWFGLYKIKLTKDILDIQQNSEPFNKPSSDSNAFSVDKHEQTSSIEENDSNTIINNAIGFDTLNIYNDDEYDGYDNSEDEFKSAKKNYQDSIINNQNISFKDTLKNSSVLDNETKSILINVAQSFATVISSKPGSGKGALCEQVMKCLCKTDKENIERYAVIPVLKDSDDSKIKNGGKNLFSHLKYEAEMLSMPGAGHDLPLSVITLKDATMVPVEDYFSSFLSLNGIWYNDPFNCNKNIIDFDGESFSVPETLRFVLTVNDDRKGCFPEHIVRQITVFEVDDPIDSADILEKFCESSSPIPYLKIKDECYKDSTTNRVLENSENEDYFGVYKDIALSIKESVLIDDYPITVDSARTFNAVSRYWGVAKDVVKEDDVLSKEKIYNTLLPKGMIIDEDRAISTNFQTKDGKKRIKEIIALDYALSQRVITFATRSEGKKVVLKDASDLFEKLLENKLYKCARCLKNAIESARILYEDELSDEANDKLITKKCDNLYERLLKDSSEKKAVSQDSLIDHICNLVNRCRDEESYTRNVISNILICLSQGFLTVFSGMPGCGKTSISRIIGESLGLTNYNEQTKPQLVFNEYKNFEDRRNENVDPSRYLEISTERGWTSKRDFIGYYNPIIEKFDKVNALLYNTFVVLDHEAREDTETRRTNDSCKDRLPCFILLDEANLSAMEYYWADFMNISEADWRESNSIDLGGGRVFMIPESLHFIATINNDHTTEILSPRLVDRANVIDLPVSQIRDIDYKDDTKEIRAISWKELKETFCPNEEERKTEWQNYKNSEDNESPFAIYKLIKEFVDERFNLSISPRTEIAVSRYYSVAKNVFQNASYLVKTNLKENLETKNNNKDETLEYLRKGILPGSATKIGYDLETVDGKKQAIDYAIAQRILPKLTDVCGETAFNDLITLVIRLLEKKLYKSAGIIADLIERGSESDFYNFFR